ncbi:MAG: acetylxylan esterase, partial [Lentisphaeria bacterium]|nr:acetylxylan esterase [Lentisphaeria bacterium]
MNSNRYPSMVQQYFVNRVDALMEERQERLNALKTKKAAEAYVTGIRRKIRTCFGKLPPKTALNPVITREQDLGDVILENVLFESRPGFLVSGNIYRPKTSGKLPVVLGLCGHSENGKAFAPYQAFARGLALRGFLTLIIDPISQGERRQFYPRDVKSGSLDCCRAHNVMGKQMGLIDDFFGTWRAWDAIRGLDLLLSDRQADKTHVGVTGCSGGGTLTTYVTALDKRVTMAAPDCFITTMLRNLKNELPSDSEQNPPGMIKSGLDQVDLLMAFAPRPTLILYEER